MLSYKRPNWESCYIFEVVNVASTPLAVLRVRPPNRPTQLPLKEAVYIQTVMDRDYWLSPRLHVSGHSFGYYSHIKSTLVFKADDGFDALQK